MLYYCPDCKIISKTPLTECPQCKRDVRESTIPPSHFSNDGYTEWACATKNKPAETHHVEENDPFAELQRDYNRQYKDSSVIENPSHTESATKENDPTPSAGSFFDQFTEAPPIPTTRPDPFPEPATERYTETTPPPGPTFRDLPQPRTRVTLSNGIYSIFSTFTRLPWRLIGRLLMIAFVVFTAIALWNLRFVILDSILNFFLSFVPIVLVLVIIVVLIKNIFR